MMFGLLRMLSKEQKADWPIHLPSLVFTYNATPHSMTGFQPYQLMFGRKAPAPCDNWLGLGKYDNQKSVSKTQWVDQMAEKLLVTNKRAMKNIKLPRPKTKEPRGDQTSIYPRVTWYFFGIIPREGIKSRTII